MQINQRIEAVFWRWAEKRSPRARQVVLQHRSIYVIPSKSAIGFLLATFLLWLLGTNYQNNLILACSFLLIGLFFVSVIHAFRNLSGVCISVNTTLPGFCGNSIDIPIELTVREGAAAHHLWLGFSADTLKHIDVSEGGSAVVNIPVPATQRGWMQPGRLMVKSYYPLGLTRVWSWVHLQAPILVYPQPKAASLAAHQGSGGDEEEGARIKADDDFMGFSQYQPGAPLSQVAWKVYARGAGLHLKQYGGAEQDSLWLDFQHLVGGVEQRLSGLCYLALEWHKAGREFGLRLPGSVITPASGDVHLHKVLKALALYEAEPES